MISTVADEIYETQVCSRSSGATKPNPASETQNTGQTPHTAKTPEDYRLFDVRVTYTNANESEGPKLQTNTGKQDTLQ